MEDKFSLARQQNIDVSFLASHSMYLCNFIRHKTLCLSILKVFCAVPEVTFPGTNKRSLIFKS